MTVPDWFRAADPETCARHLGQLLTDGHDPDMRFWLRHQDPALQPPALHGCTAADLHLIADFWPGPPPHPPTMPAAAVNDIELCETAITMAGDPWWTERDRYGTPLRPDAAARVLAETAHRHHLPVPVLAGALCAIAPPPKARAA